MIIHLIFFLAVSLKWLKKVVYFAENEIMLLFLIKVCVHAFNTPTHPVYLLCHLCLHVNESKYVPAGLISILHV